MKVVEDEQAFFTLVSNLLVDFWFVNPASDWACEECTVIDTAHVVACASETKGNPQHENSSVDPTWVVPILESKEFPFKHVRRKDW